MTLTDTGTDPDHPNPTTASDPERLLADFRATFEQMLATYPSPAALDEAWASLPTPYSVAELDGGWLLFTSGAVLHTSEVLFNHRGEVDFVPEMDWAEKSRMLKQFVLDHGRFPKSKEVADGVHLGKWLQRHRTGYRAYRLRQGSFRVEHFELLERIPGMEWEPPTGRPVQPDLWDQRHKEVVAFLDEHGHYPIGASRKRTLYDWVRNQQKNRSSLTAAQRARLEALPKWDWERSLDGVAVH